MSQIILIGEKHIDPFRKDRYLEAIEKFNPDTISLETNAYDYKKAIDYHNRLNDVEETLEETAESGEQARLFKLLHRNHVALYPALDEKIKQFEKNLVFTEDNPDYVYENQERALEQAERLYNISVKQLVSETRDVYAKNTYVVPEDFSASYMKENLHAEQKIRQAQGDVLHFGGLDHIFGEQNGYSNLYDLLQDKDAARFKLNRVSRKADTALERSPMLSIRHVDELTVG